MRLLPKIVLAVVLPVMAGAGAVLYVLAGSWQQTLERELKALDGEETAAALREVKDDVEAHLLELAVRAA